MELPLKGIKVIDFTGVQAGPACCQMLAWFGADVVKVERVGVGDVTRHQLRDIPNLDALYFTQLNSNKRSLEVNTRTPEGKAIMEKLIREADVLVENFRPGAMDRMGLSWEHIQELNPRIIFGSVKGFSPGSPYEDISVYDNVAGYLEEYPQYPNGKFGDAVPRGGNAGGGGQPGWVLKCKGWETDPNSYIYFTIQEQNWERTCEAIGKPEWAKDPAYATARARQPKIFDIFAEIEKWLADKTKFEAIDILRKFEVPCGPVLSMRDLAHDPFLRASGSIVEVQHETRGTYLTVGCPIKFSGFTPKITGAPLLGEHTDQVLTELGYSKEQIAKLRGEKVVGSSGLSPEKSDMKRAS